MDEQLERQGAANHRFPPRPLVGSARPPSRARRRPSPPSVIRPRRGAGRPAAPGGRRSGRAAPPALPSRRSSPLIEPASRVGSPAPQEDRAMRLAAVGRDRCPAPATQTRRPAPVGEAGLDPPAHRHAPRQSLDASSELASRRQADAGQKHRVGHADHALLGNERRLQDVGLGHVAALGGELTRRGEPKAAAALRVENGGEDARRVEIRQAQPVDRAVRAQRAPRSARRRSRRSHEAVRSRRCAPGQPR